MVVLNGFRFLNNGAIDGNLYDLSLPINSINYYLNKLFIIFFIIKKKQGVLMTHHHMKPDVSIKGDEYEGKS